MSTAWRRECRRLGRLGVWLLVAVPLLGGVAWATEGDRDDRSPKELDETAVSVSGSMIEGLSAELGDLAREVLARNPRLVARERRADALATRPNQAGSLPDPMASMNLFVLSPETRTGPQRLLASVAQRLPWFGKLSLQRQAATLVAAAAGADVEALRVELVTETRRLFHELTFQDELARILVEERQTLRRHEEAARARYSAGMGLQQETVRIQAQLTRLETRLLDIDQRRATLRASLNALRDRPADTPMLLGESSAGAHRFGADLPRLDLDELRRLALEWRPEVRALDATIASQEAMVELAKKGYRPDVTLGLAYTVVDPRRDPAGRAQPPPDNGDDIVALTGSVNLPIYRRRLDASLEEALAMRSAAEERKRELVASIERAIGDRVARMPLLAEQLALFADVLLVQAEEALRSAEAAYATGRLNAVDLLDAEVVLFEVQRSMARTETDLLTVRAELEGAVARLLF